MQATTPPASRRKSSRRWRGPTKAIRWAMATSLDRARRAANRRAVRARGRGFSGATGTAANALALAHLTPPWGAVLCHAEAHIVTDECGAPEFFGGGIKLIGLPGEAGKIAPALLKDTLDARPMGRPASRHPGGAVADAGDRGRHHLSARRDRRAGRNRSRAWTRRAYGRRALRQCAGAAQCLAGAGDLEGRRRRAVVRRDQGRRAGGRGRGVLRSRARRQAWRNARKRGGHLVSKHRFIAAQIEAYLADDLWLKLARHANAMADRLGAALAGVGFPPVWPVEANEVFVMMPLPVQERLQAAGASLLSLDDQQLAERHAGFQQRGAHPPGHVVPDHNTRGRRFHRCREWAVMPRHGQSLAPIGLSLPATRERWTSSPQGAAS